MSVFFLKIWNMSINATWVILVVLMLRLVLRKAPRWISCMLWALVAVRLICPFSFESALSLLPSGEVIPSDIAMERKPELHTGIPVIDHAVNPVLSDTLAPHITDSVNPLQVVIFVATIVWISGMVLMLFYAVLSWILLRRRVRASMPVGEGILACDEVKTAFILGVFSPRIYVSSAICGKTLEMVLAHERAHLKRHDHWWKPLGFLLLSVYWFHPACWLAYVLLCRDMEAACDEKVIRDQDRDFMAAYSQALLELSVSRRSILASPLAFGEMGVKERVKGVLHYKKPAFWVIVVALIACVIAAVCFLTNPKTLPATEEREAVLTEPPSLSILCEGASFLATRGSFSWESVDAEGNGVATEADSPHPLFMAEEMQSVPVTAAPASIQLLFETEPEQVSVRYWDAKYVGDESSYEAHFEEANYAPNQEIVFPDGADLIVEVVGTWTYGNCHYCFRIESKAEEAGVSTGDKAFLLVYADAFDGKELVFDQIEWVEVPGERATELGLTDEDAPSGFAIYNEAVQLEKLSLAENCVCTILDWTAGYVQKDVTAEEWKTVLEERAGTYIPYQLTIENNEITEIMEHYVP